MKTLRKIGAVLFSIAMCISLASCSNDDDDNSGGGAPITIDGNKAVLSHCYIVEETNGVEIIFSSVDYFSTSMPKSMTQFNVCVNHGLSNLSGTYSAHDYDLEYAYIPNLKDELVSIGYLWDGSWPNMTSVKQPGDVTIKVDGDNISVTVNNYWMVSGEDNDGWGSNDDFSGSKWVNGTFTYNGKYKVLDDSMFD